MRANFFASHPIKSERIKTFKMAKRYVIKDLESQYPDLEQKILKLVNNGGQNYAAHQLNTTQPTISKFLKDRGYIKQEQWIKNPELERAS